MIGRPPEGRVKLTCYVLPLTARRIAFLVDKRKADVNTQGKVVDSQFGVQAGANVAGRGRRVLPGRDGRAKRSSGGAQSPIGGDKLRRDGASQSEGTIPPSASSPG